MTYSLDFRKHVLSVKAEEGLTYEEASCRFKIGKASLVRWNKEIEPKSHRIKPATKINMEQLKDDIGSSLVTVRLFEATINAATFESGLEHDLLPKIPRAKVTKAKP